MTPLMSAVVSTRCCCGKWKISKIIHFSRTDRSIWTRHGNSSSSESKIWNFSDEPILRFCFLSAALLIFMMIAILCLLATEIKPPSQTQLPTLPAGYVGHPEIGVAYKLYGDLALWEPWERARQQCHRDGAELAVIDSWQKLEILRNQGPLIDELACWVGIHNVDDKWVSASTGSTLINIPWASGEPESAQAWVSGELVPLDCAEFQRDMKRGLNNWICSFSAGYVCEIPIP